MGRGRGVCHHCGGTEHVLIGTNERRCTECGETSKFVTMRTGGNPTPAQLEAGLDQMRSIDRQRDVAFATADFSVYGLDERWAGLRSFSGWGHSNGITSHLGLAFGNAADRESSLLRVDTHRGSHASPIERYVLARTLVMQLGHEVDALPDDVRALAFPHQNPELFQSDMTEHWDDSTIMVEAVPLPVKVLTVEDHWVAIASVDDLVIGLSGQRWPLADVRLVEVTDFAAYAEGVAEIRRMMTSRYADPD